MTITTRTPTAIDAAPVYSGAAFGPMVGDDTALDTSDGDTSYVEVTHNGFSTFTGHTFQWEPAGAIPTTATVTIEADWFTDNHGAFAVAFVHPTLGGRSVATFTTDGVETTHAYGATQTRTISSTWVEDGAAFMPGVQWEIQGFRSDLFVSVSSRITRLTLLIDGVASAIPLRQFHRDDGLGVTPPRAYGGSSRTRTGRAYGYT